MCGLTITICTYVKTTMWELLFVTYIAAIMCLEDKKYKSLFKKLVLAFDPSKRFNRMKEIYESILKNV